MKHLMLFLIIVIAVTGCVNNTNRLTGLYVSSTSNEFSDVKDSLLVSAGTANDLFVIRRSMSINYVREDERLPQHKTDTWNAAYDVKTNMLSVQQNGKTLYFDEEKNGFFLGKTLYKKIDDANLVDDLVSRNK